MSNLWYILNKSEHQRLQQQLQQQLRQQLEFPPGMSSDRFQYPTTTPTASPTAVGPSRDILPFGQYPPTTDVSFDPNAPPPTHMPPNAEGHNNIEWKYHTHRPEADGDSLGRKAGKRKLVIPRDLLKMKQMHAAMKIGIPPSTFSKRWRESLPDRTWPYRNHRRIEKNIKMLKAMQHKGHDVTEELGRMQQQQEENLSPAVIDVYEDVNEEYLMKVDEKKWPTTGRQGTPPAGVHHHPYPPPNTPASAQQQMPAGAAQSSPLQIPPQQLAQIQAQLAHANNQPKLISVHPIVQQPQLQSSPISIQAPLQTTPLQTAPQIHQSPPPTQVSSVPPTQTLPSQLQDVKPVIPSSSTSSSSSSESHPATEAPSTSNPPINQHITEQSSGQPQASLPSSSSPTLQSSPAPVQAPPSSSLPQSSLEQPVTASPPSQPSQSSPPQSSQTEQQSQQTSFPLSTTPPP